MAPTRNADEKPSTRASGSIVAVARESSVRDLAIVESAAMPSAPPICCDVLIRPDASPASDAFTPASAEIEIGTKENPIPTPMIRKPGRRSPT
jgi:hypothetical protein